MKKKNAFTLIELLAVLIIISVILLLIGPQILNKINDSKDTLYDTQIEEIKKAGRVYVSKTNIDFDSLTDKQITITLGELKKAGLIDKDIKNPRNGEKLNDCITVTITKKEENFQYKVNDDITQNENCEISEQYSLILIGNANVKVKKNTSYKDDGILLKGNLGNFLDIYDVDVKIYKNGSLYKDNLKYYNFENEIDTSELTSYLIEYKYEDSTVSRIVEVVNKVENITTGECKEPTVVILNTLPVGTSKVNINYYMTNATKAEVQYKKSIDSNYTTANSIECSLNGCIVTGLTAGTNYNFLVKAINNCENDSKETETEITESTGTVSSPEFLDIEPTNSSFVNVGSTKWTKANVNFKIKYYDTGFVNPQHYFYVESHETPTQDNITANKTTYYCGTTEPGDCQNTEIASGNRLTEGWYKVADDEVTLTYDREYEYHFTALTKDAENREVASLTTNSIDKTAPTITLGTNSATENTIYINYTPADQLTDRNVIGAGINSSKTKCKCGTNSSNLNITSSSATSSSCSISGLTANTTYYCKVYAEDNVGNTSESELATIKTDEEPAQEMHTVTLYNCSGGVIDTVQVAHGENFQYNGTLGCQIMNGTDLLADSTNTLTFRGWSKDPTTISASQIVKITEDTNLYAVHKVTSKKTCQKSETSRADTTKDSYYTYYTFLDNGYLTCSLSTYSPGYPSPSTCETTDYNPSYSYVSGCSIYVSAGSTVKGVAQEGSSGQNAGGSYGYGRSCYVSGKINYTTETTADYYKVNNNLYTVNSNTIPSPRTLEPGSYSYYMHSTSNGNCTITSTY